MHQASKEYTRRCMFYWITVHGNASSYGGIFHLSLWALGSRGFHNVLKNNKWRGSDLPNAKSIKFNMESPWEGVAVVFFFQCVLGRWTYRHIVYMYMCLYLTPFLDAALNFRFSLFHHNSHSNIHLSLRSFFIKLKQSFDILVGVVLDSIL